VFVSNVATAAIEQAQWSSTQPNNTSAAAAIAIAQAQAASQASYPQYQQVSQFNALLWGIQESKKGGVQ